jgi:hypothetical protein
LRDSAESDLRPSEGGAGRNDPKLPFAGFDGEDENDGFDGKDDDERCDENPLLKDDELPGLASAGAGLSARIRDSARATCAYFEKVFSMVRSADES